MSAARPQSPPMKPAHPLSDPCSFLELRQGWLTGGSRGNWVCAESHGHEEITPPCSVELTLPTLLSCLPLPLFPLESQVAGIRPWTLKTHG